MRLQVIVLVLGLSLLYAAPGASAQLGGSDSSAMVCIDEKYECWRGVPGAAVTLSKAGLIPANHETTTDEEGWFGFSDVEDGTYSLSISRTGFETYSAEVAYPFTEESFSLIPEVMNVSGSVKDAAGAAIFQAQVSAWGERGGSETMTAQDGTFAMDLTSGYLQFDVWAKGFLRFSGEKFVDGSAVSFELSEAPPSDATVSGIVRDQDGTAVSGVRVEGWQWGYYDDAEGHYYDYGYEDNPQHATTDSAGRYELAARQGEMNLNFWKDGYAGSNAYLQIEAGEDLNHDVKMLKYPDKTAYIEGRLYDADSGKAIRWASISFQSVEYGIYGCSMYANDDRGRGHSPEPVEPQAEYEGDYAVSEPSSSYYPYYEQCDITIHEDGTFTGNVTPGYTSVNVWFDHYRTCSESSSSDGSYSRTCGQDYFGWVGTFDLAEDSTTKVAIGLKARPGPDATVQGYAVDKETQKAIPGARFSFSNQDGYAWGEAQTDQDGSYKVKIRSGYQHVYVWAEGYLPWQGVVEIKKGATLEFDVDMKQGEARYGGYGGCCYAYAEDSVASDGAEAPPRAAGADDMEESGGLAGPSRTDGGSGDGDFEDLEGGLGPYDAAKRQKQLESGKDSPGMSVMILGLTLGVLVWVQRRN